MISMNLAVLVAGLIAAGTGTTFERTLKLKLRQGGTLRLTTRGTVGTGTQHGSSKVVLAFVGAENEPRVEYTNGDLGLLPIFTQLTELSPNLVFALGWSSGGGGAETYTAWLVRVDADVVELLDRVDITQPRAFPNIRVRASDGAIALFRGATGCSGEDPGAALQTGRGTRIDLCGQPPAKPGGAVEAWPAYVDHPFGMDKPGPAVFVGKMRVIDQAFRWDAGRLTR